MIRARTRRRALAAAAAASAFFPSPGLLAATCEQTFEAIGDPRNGLAFISRHRMEGLSVESALGQIRRYGELEGLVVSAERMDGRTGQVYLVRESTKPPLVLSFTATPGGAFNLGTKLARGQSMDVEAARQLMCGMLTRLKAGAEGEAIADAARKASTANRVVETKAVDLSRALGKEADKLKRAMNAGSFRDRFDGSTTSPDQLRDREAMMRPFLAKYSGRRYRIDGEVYTASFNEFLGIGTVAWLVTKPRGILRVRQSDLLNNFGFTLSCDVVRNETALVKTLRSHDFVTLEGTVDEVTLDGIVLKDCHQAK